MSIPSGKFWLGAFCLVKTFPKPLLQTSSPGAVSERASSGFEKSWRRRRKVLVALSGEFWAGGEWSDPSLSSRGALTGPRLRSLILICCVP